MNNVIEIPDYAEVDVRRPNGVVETVRTPLSQMGGSDFAAMKKATAAAGRGEVLAYRNIKKQVEAPKPTAADLADMEYVRHQNAVYRMAAGGEDCDQIGGARDIDRTPAHPTDY